MTERERRAVLWGSIMILGIVGLRVLPGAMGRMRARQASVQTLAGVVGRMRRDLDAMDALTDSVRLVRSELVGLDSTLLDAHTEIGANGELSLRMRSFADRFVLDMQRIVPITDTTLAPPFRRAALAASFECDSRGLLRMLRAAATEPPVLDVTSLDIAATDPGSDPSLPEVLRVEIVVGGWYLDKPELP